MEIICIGKLKEAYLREASAEYEKRLAPYTKLKVTELREERQKGEGPAAEAAVAKAEGERLLAAASSVKGSFVVALDSRGKKTDSEGFAEVIREAEMSGKGRTVFLIGGSLGFSDEVRKNADILLSFSDMTFPHQLMRVILLEQIYRAFKIMRGEKYHK
jgi:23S rRNA (pseudouridine1915-N3)-methyltransferase